MKVVYGQMSSSTEAFSLLEVKQHPSEAHEIEFFAHLFNLTLSDLPPGI